MYDIIVVNNDISGRRYFIKKRSCKIFKTKENKLAEHGKLNNPEEMKCDIVRQTELTCIYAVPTHI